MPTHALARSHPGTSRRSPYTFLDMVQIVHPDPYRHSANKHPNCPTNPRFNALEIFKTHSKKAKPRLHGAWLLVACCFASVAGETVRD